MCLQETYICYCYRRLANEPDITGEDQYEVRIPKNKNSKDDESRSGTL